MTKIIPLFLLLFPLTAISQPTLDTSFGENGFVYFNTPTMGYARPYIKQQTDGKLIVSGGRLISNDPESYILRLEPNGSIDSSYGDNGRYWITLPGDDPDTNGPDIYLLPDNSLIYFSHALAKLTPEGTLDNSFVQDAGHSPFYTNYLSFMDPQSSHIYFSSPSAVYSGVQRIHTSTGLLDTTFGDATHTVVLGPGLKVYSGAFAQPNGNITCLVINYSSAQQWQCNLKQVLPDGSPDVTFGIDGFARAYGTPEFVSFTDFTENFVYDEAHSLYVVVYSLQEIQSHIFKFDASGQPDLSFGNNGKLTLPADQFILDVYPHNGSLYLLGRKIMTPNIYNDCHLLLAKYNLDGQPDPNFGTDGTYIEYGNPYLESGEDLLFTADGGIIVVGETNEPGLHRPFAVKYTEQALQTQKFDAYRVSYQNPVEDLLTVHGTGISEVSLFGPDGRLAASGNENSVATSGLASGLYLARISFTDGHVQTVKISKR